MGQDRLQRESFHRGYWPHDRVTLEPMVADDTRYSEPQDIRRPPMSIVHALREYCNVPGKFYCVVAIGHDGKPTVFTAPQVPSLDVHNYFNAEAFSRDVNRALAAVEAPYEEPELSFDPEMGRYGSDMSKRWQAERRYGHPMSLENFEEVATPKTRKRQRQTSSGGHDIGRSSIEPTISSTPSRRGIVISNDKEVWDFYGQRFRDCQQMACKLIAKAWVKAVEPKKQSTHPYTGKEEKAPEWWPKPWGTSKDERVRHKEPDHLYRHERVHLLIHILRMIVLPNHRQHHAIQKLHLNVTKLEEITNEALSSFFTDKDNPLNFKKRPFLKEIFKVAKLEERFHDEEIDPTTIVYVSSNDQISQDYASDTEEFGVKDEDEQHGSGPISSSASPQRLATSHALLSQEQGQDSSSPNNNMVGGGYVGDLVVRPTPFAPSLITPDLGSERQSFEGHNVATHTNGNLGLSEIYASPHDSSRKSSIFTPASEYASPTTPIYPQWQTGSTAPSSHALYSFTSQSPTTHHHFVSQPGVSIPPHQHYMGNPFDSLPRASHDQQGGIYRAPAGYSNYLPQDASTVPLPGVKAEALHRPTPQ